MPYSELIEDQAFVLLSIYDLCHFLFSPVINYHPSFSHEARPVFLLPSVAPPQCLTHSRSTM